METCARLVEIAAQEAQVHDAYGTLRSTVVELGRRRSGAEGSPILITELTEDEGRTITQLHDVEVKATQLIVARGAIIANGSDRAVALAPLDLRVGIGLHEHASDRKCKHPQVTIKSIKGK